MKRHDSMRGYYAYYLHEAMTKDEKIVVLTGDLGYAMLDSIRDDYPTRFFNVGASEQAMIGIAVGMALQGLKPFCYSISTFLIYRPYEAIRLYIDHEKIPVRLIGGGRDKDYHIDGISHDATHLPKVLKTVPNIKTFWPQSKEVIESHVKWMVKHDVPSFISLRR